MCETLLRDAGQHIFSAILEYRGDPDADKVRCRLWERNDYNSGLSCADCLFPKGRRTLGWSCNERLHCYHVGQPNQSRSNLEGEQCLSWSTKYMEIEIECLIMKFEFSICPESNIVEAIAGYDTFNA